MENTQSFNTQLGIKQLRAFYADFNSAKKNQDRLGMAEAYDAMAKACNLFPPCDVVSSLRNDINDYQVKNILLDVKVIEDDQDKIKY